MSKILRVAIATDLHYIKDVDGNISVQVCANGTKNDPMAGLLDFLKDDECGIGNSADILICPGDITTGACIESFDHGWGELNRLRSAMNASQLIAATGNHEIVSRASKEHTFSGNAEISVAPFDHLITTKGYPANFESPDGKWVYWGRGYEAVYGENWVVVTINTCHFHGTLLPNEYERGRIGAAALQEIKSVLVELSKKYVYRMVVLHHPPLNHEEFGVDLGRVPMFNGDLLLKAIEDTGKDWLIIHGHKHLHRLTRSSGAEYAPIVLGAASFGALLTGEIASQTRNQFYIVELSVSDDEGEDRLRGRIEAICWDGAGWNVCNDIAQGLPNGCGFDQSSQFRSNRVANAIKQLLREKNLELMMWEEVQGEISELRYLMPKELENLVRKLDEIGVKRTPLSGKWFPEQLWLNS